jgi:hypothetical protein
MTARLVLFAVLFPAVLLAQQPAASPAAAPKDSAPSPASIQAGLRSRLLDFSGALGNEGFKVRDGCWTGRLEGGKARSIKLNFFAGNQYWLCAAVPGEGRGLQIKVYDAAAKPVEVIPYQQAGLAAAGLTADRTGLYFVEIQTSPGQSPDFCFTYLFR